MKEYIQATDKIKEMLANTMILANFYKFRVNNPSLDFTQSMQIISQKSNATICKSFDEWNRLKRRVKMGESALYYTNSNNPNYKHYVFDITQTNGVDYPPKVYHKRDIVKCVQNLCYLPPKINISNYSSLVASIKQYNLEEGFDKDLEIENKFLERYIAIFVNATFDDAITIPDNIDFGDTISLERKVELCAEAEEIASNMSQYILNERNYYNEYGELFSKKQDEIIETDEETTGVTTFEEVIKERKVSNKIRSSSTKLLKGLSQSQVSMFDFGGQFDGLSTENPNTSEQYGNNANGTNISNDNPNNLIYGAFGNIATSEVDGGRNSDGTNNLSELKNYVLTDDNFVRNGGAKARYEDNVKAITLLKQLDEESRQLTYNEKLILSKYSGWGAIPQVFDNTNEDWKKEYSELKDLLSITEYDNAKGSTLNAHFTSKTIIDAVYNGLKQLGFVNGKILEPAVGTGNFIGLMPDSFAKHNVTGVEIDGITGKIAKYLYPESNIQIKGFEETNFANNEFDAVITNVPFGNYKVYDKDFNKYNFLIHDYFIAKSIDKIRPNGICAVITSKGTLDKKSTEFRKYLADRAELLGAIRLPNNAFKENAGTEVTSDILFLKKRGTVIDCKDSWINTSTNEEGITVNNYYIEHPEMLAGIMKIGIGMYGPETFLQPFEDKTLKESLDGITEKLPKNVYKEEKKIASVQNIGQEILPADYSVRNFCYVMINDCLYMRVDDQMLLQKVAKNNLDRISQMINIRNEVRVLLDKQINNCTDDELKIEQSRLEFMYGKFVRQYGYLNSKFNRNLFHDDADYALLVSLEDYNEQEKTATKTAIFTKRTIRVHERVTRANNAFEALQISKNELGKVDLKYMEQLTGKDFDSLVKELDSCIYLNPVLACEDKYVGWETANEYLSGNVKQKLSIAELAMQDNSFFAKNVDALKLAQPAPIPASDISARLGATWIDSQYYKQFITEKLNVNRYISEETFVEYNKYNGSFVVKTPTVARMSFDATNVYGTSRINAFDIFEHSLNLQIVTIYDKIEEDGKERRIVNQQETILAREKQKRLEEEFKSWIFDNQERRNLLVDKYNQLFNNTKLQNFNGDYLTFPEMNPTITLKKHQVDAVERIITSGNTLLHHVVGAGKTFEIVASAMKLKQYGLAHKSMIVVPNHLVAQWTRDFKLLYPNSNVLMATKKDLEKQNRLKFVAKVATGDWDAVIIAASSFEKIPISKERQERKIKEELQAIENEIEEINNKSYHSGTGDKISIKMLEQAKKAKQTQLKKLLESKTKDTLIKFEDLGVNYLFVDEAHKYKNKFIYTKMRNVAGISQAMSQRAMDLDMKCEYINELHKAEKGVVFATGTPISNSMVEMYTMQSYMQKEKLKEAGINYFDAWAALFGETQNALELAPSGNGYRTKTRFARFTNLPELMKMYRSFADVKTADQLSLPVPKANKITIIAKPSEDVLRLSSEIQERAEKIHLRMVTPEVDNMLKITSDGKKIALDPRIYDKNSDDDYENKLNVCVRKVFEIWESTKENKSTQIIFCDNSTPKTFNDDYNKEQDFDVYNDIKNKLVEMGVPSSEVRFIHEAKTDLQKQSLFDEVTNGQIRVLLGSTEKCGAGTNIQKRLIALHHLDTPYRPSDLEQREGRIIRQGNMNDVVNIYTYVTEKTFDSYSYQILENKQKFISQINNGDLTIREASDIDDTTLSYAEIKAITTANPKIKEKMELEQELSRLRTLESQYNNNRYVIEDKISKDLPQSIAFTDSNIQNISADIEMRNKNLNNNAFAMKIGNNLYSERVEAGKALLKFVRSNTYNNQVVGNIYGFNIIPQSITNLTDERKITVVGQGKYSVPISESEVGCILKIENFIKGFEDKLQANKIRNEDLKKQLASAKEELKKPFEHKEKILEITNRLASLDAELDLNNEEVVVIDEDENAIEESIVNTPQIQQESEVEVE